MATERGFGDLQPSIWKYEYIQSLRSEYKEESYIKKREVLKEEVRMMLCEVENHVHQLELIDILQRLGVAYHFKDEIKSILDNIYNMEIFNTKKILYATALQFRLLRQHGYDISADVFDFFLKETNNFNEHQPSIGVEGILSLYESSFYLVEEETILDDAKKYSSKILKEYVKRNYDSYISLLINHSLEYPLHWRVPRWEAFWFINTYEKSRNLNPTLLQFAKLDFNIIQSIYQEELKDMSRWWKRTYLAEKLSFARDRLMENFFWTVGVNFNPEFGSFRRAITKVNCFINTIDDMYETFGTLEDLELFTKAVERWDLSFGMDNLPYYMKICFLAL
ncbi:Myrcene synthase [Arachis hypogaea]|nr:Myrcene synthase [Arachis hypogaea]